jgi:DNA-binding response OmpR family regulator
VLRLLGWMSFREIPRAESPFVRADLPRHDHHATRRSLSTRTIVVIDDEAGLSDIIAATLLDVGYRVYTGWNGVVGLELIAEHTPDLVILDYTMPLLDGAGVLRGLWANRSLSHVPVVMMSAMPESVVQEHCSGYATFVRKPFDVDTMLNAVRRTLGNQ